MSTKTKKIIFEKLLQAEKLPKVEKIQLKRMKLSPEKHCNPKMWNSVSDCLIFQNSSSQVPRSKLHKTAHQIQPNLFYQNIISIITDYILIFKLNQALPIKHLLYIIDNTV